MKTTSAGRYAKANAPGVLLYCISTACGVFAIQSFFFAPFRISFKTYHNKLFRVDFVCGILEFFLCFFLMPSATAHYLSHPGTGGAVFK